MPLPGRETDDVALRHRLELSLREEEPVPRLANADLEAIVVVELGEILGIGKGDRLGVKIDRAIAADRQRLEHGCIVLWTERCVFLHDGCVPFCLNLFKKSIIMLL